MGFLIQLLDAGEVTARLRIDVADVAGGCELYAFDGWIREIFRDLVEFVAATVLTDHDLLETVGDGHAGLEVRHDAVGVGHAADVGAMTLLLEVALLDMRYQHPEEERTEDQLEQRQQIEEHAAGVRLSV